MSGWSTSTGICIRTPCATPLPHTCWPTGPTCAPFRSCLGIPRFPPRSATRTPRSANSSRCTIRPILAPEAPANHLIFFRRLLHDGGGRLRLTPPAEQEADVPRAALAAAERAKEQRQEDHPLDHTSAMGPEYIFAPVLRAPPRARRERNRVYLGHEAQALRAEDVTPLFV